MSEVPAVGDQQDEEAAAEPEHPAPRERRDLHDEEEAEHHGETRPPRVPRLEPQVDRQHQHEDRGELDPEVVRVAGQRVDAEDVLPLDRAVDVDLARAARQRLQPARVEVPPRPLGDQELRDAVGGVRRHPGDERAEGEPVEPNAAARDERDAGDEEEEVEQELHHPLRPLRERLRRLQVEPADQVDEQEGDEEAEGDQRRALDPRVEPLRAVHEEGEEEERGDHVGERERSRHLPLELRVRHREDGHEEEALDERRALRDGARTVEGDRGHGGVMVRRARAGYGGWISSHASRPAPRASATELAPCGYEVIPSYMTFHRPQPSRRTSAST